MEYYNHNKVHGSKKPTCNSGSKKYYHKKYDPKQFDGGLDSGRTERDIMMNKRFSYAPVNVHPNKYQTL